MTRPIITLTTDFGTADAFVGSMKGVILGIAPDAQIIDLTHSIPPQDVRAGAFSLASTHHYFPEKTIHLVVVDPSVGTQRRPIAVTTASATFVCPDNGLLSYLIGEAASRVENAPFAITRVALPIGWRAVHLSNSDYWHNPLSMTFHGRDLFAPVAAHLARGVPMASMGNQVGDIAAFAVPQSRSSRGSYIGQVLHVDRFGNLITNLRSSDLPHSELEIRITGRTISGLSKHYQVKEELLAIINSSGVLEIAVPNGDASLTLGATIGDEVRVITKG